MTQMVITKGGGMHVMQLKIRGSHLTYRVANKQVCELVEVVERNKDVPFLLPAVL